MTDLRAEDITFPPLLWGEEVTSDALNHAVRKATIGCDAGFVAYVLGPSKMEAALVFAPEVPLTHAMTMLPLCGLGFQNALGALAPPEVAVHLEWDRPERNQDRGEENHEQRHAAANRRVAHGDFCAATCRSPSAARDRIESATVPCSSELAS